MLFPPGFFGNMSNNKSLNLVQQQTEELHSSPLITNSDISAHRKYLPKTPYQKFSTDVQMSRANLFEDRLPNPEIMQDI